MVKNINTTKLYKCFKSTLLSVLVFILVFALCSCDNETKKPSDSPETLIETSENDPMESLEAEKTGSAVDSNKIPVHTEKSNGIDVSKWQGAIDWKAVSESGVGFAFIRVGYRGENGLIYKDEFAEYNIQQAQKYNILVGVYFFSTAINEAEAEEEAQFVLDFVEGYKISYPIVYDCEGYRSTTSRMHYLSAKMRTDNAIAFLDKIKSAGYDAMHYGARNELMIPFYWDIGRIAENYKIWVAIYPEITYPDVEYPEYLGRIDAWQYTDKGSVNGITGDVDLVVCYFKSELCEPKNPDAVIVVADEPLYDGNDLYKRVNEQVTAKDVTNLRTHPSTDSEIVASIENGTFVTRIGIGNKGWSMIDYEGQTVYAVTSYLTTEIVEQTDEILGNLFKAQTDKVTAKISVNLRSLPTTEDSEVLGTLEHGTFIERVAVSDKGWSKLIYNGQTVYAVSSYLTTQLIIETDPSEDVTFLFDEVDESVTAKIETNLRTFPSTEESEVVYTLPNGEYVRRVGVNKITGWSKLEYEGEIVYAMTLYLTLEQVETDIE